MAFAPAPGDVLLFKAFDFEEFGRPPAQKLWVVYGVNPDGNVLGFLATSQPKPFREAIEGCYSRPKRYEGYFFLPPARKKKPALERKKPSPPRFEKETWIVFNPFLRGLEELDHLFHKGEMHRLFTLGQHDRDQIRQCFKESPEYAPFYDGFQ